jgi:hypothetical protein
MSISTVTSEALQLKLRQLLPSQQGFSTDLSASDTIIPIIDLTGAAEGSGLPFDLQTASSFAAVNEFRAVNATAVIANTAGFWKILYAVTLPHNTTKNLTATISLSDGTSTKNLWKAENYNNNDVGTNSFQGHIYVFLNAGETVSAITNDSEAFLIGSAIQVADNNGVLTNPAGFTPQ